MMISMFYHIEMTVKKMYINHIDISYHIMLIFRIFFIFFVVHMS